MTVSVAGRPLQSASMLSSLGRQVLACIDGGAQWLEWAARSMSPRYDFPEERSLLTQVQRGLHGTSMLWLPQLGLQVGPAKLLTLGSDDLVVLLRAESGGDSQTLARAVQRVLAAHDLVTNAQLASGDAFLAELGVDTAPLLQTLDFDARLAVWRLATAQSTARAVDPRAAADFALAQAQSALQFCDYYRYYLQSAADSDGTDVGQAAASALQTLLPALFDALDGPGLDTMPTPSEIEQAAHYYLATGRTIGFARLSLAAQQIAAQLPRRDRSAARLHGDVEAVLRGAQEVLRTARLRDVRMGQDGDSLHVLAQNDRQHVRLQLVDKVLTIGEIGAGADVAADTAPIEPPPPARAPAAARPLPAPVAAPDAPPPPRETRENTEQRLKQSLSQVEQRLRDAERMVEEARAAAEASIQSAMAAADVAIREATAAADAAIEEAKRQAAAAEAASSRASGR